MKDVKKGVRRSIIIILLCIVGLICTVIGFYKYLQEKNAGKEYDEIKREVEQSTIEHTTLKEDIIKIPVDFTELQKENPEIYAWIKIDGTEVDYPIVQSNTDNSYYLTHNVGKKESLEGAIFTENYNSKTFNDPNTLIYGHNMKNGTMFQTLHRFMDKDFFDKNRDIEIYTPTKILHYKIFAAYLSDASHILKKYDFNDKQVYQSYLNGIFSIRSIDAFVDSSIEVTNSDKIITLSTCYANLEYYRYLVQAVLVSTELMN